MSTACAGEAGIPEPGEYVVAKGGAVKSYVIDKCPRCGETLVQRTLEQNDKFHALLGDIAKQKQWAGQWLTISSWKQLISAAYERSREHRAVMYPAIDGQGIDVVYWHSHRRSKQDMSELIEFTTAWAIDNEVRLSAPESMAEHG